MIAEWLAAWGVKSAVGFAFEKVLAPLAQDASKYWVRNFCGKVLTNVIEQPKKRELKKAAGLAIREFLVLFQQELEDADLSDDDLIMFEEPLKYYVQEKAVLEILGGPLQPEFEGLDVAELNSQWENLKTRPPGLPEDFDWQNIAKRYPRKVKAILRESEVLRNLLNALHQEESADSLRQIAGVSPDFDLQKYREGLLERYGNLNLESLDATGAYYELKLWGVFIAQTVRECREYLPRVYEMPKEVQARLKKTGEMPDDLSEQDLERFQKAYQEQPVRPVPEAIEDPQNKYMVVLGDPGSGKSTLLQYLALEWAREPLRERSLEPLPLLIELRTYARDCENGVCNDILSFCHTGNVCCRLNDLELKKQLDAGNVVALFDGLDEVFDPARREDVITAIHRFSNDYPNVRIMVTSRVIGYKPQKLKDAEFHHFMLQDLDEEQVEEFINKWHDLTFTEKWEKERKRDRLKRAIEDSSAISQLAGNPLLLTMMAILNRNQELPRDRAELYHQCSRLLLHQWDIERQLVDKELDYKAIDFKDKQAMLRRVAFFMQSSEKGLAGNLIYKDDLEQILWDYLKEMDVREPRKVARLLIEQLRVRNFILCHVGADWYAFVHRTFLEYFCAWEFVWQFEKERKLSFEQLRDEVYGAHWADKKWHEVLRLIAGMIEAGFVGQIIEYLMEQDGESEKCTNLFLAAECLNEVRNRKPISDIDSRLLNWQKKLIRYDLKYPYKPWDEEAHFIIIDIRKKAVSAVASVWKNTSATQEWLKRRATQDEDWGVRQASLMALVLGWKGDPDTLSIIKSRATEDDNGIVRYAAVTELVRGWKEDSDTLSIIKSRASEDDDEDVRYKAMTELVRGWKDDPDTLPIIKSRATQDDDNNVRKAAVQELARGWKDDPDTLPIIKSRATQEYDNDMRQAAITELIRGWKDDPETLSWLKTRATEDENGWVCRAAMIELARGWKDDPDIYEFLCNCAVNNPFERFDDAFSFFGTNPRQTALKALAQYFPDRSRTRALLQDRATQDDDNYVRQSAVQELARGWKDDPDTLPIIKSRATQDDDNYVRQSAVQELARGWKDDPDILPIIKSRATQDDDNEVRKAAVQELARGWKDDPDTYEVLCDCVINDLFKRSDSKFSFIKNNPRQAALEALVRHSPDRPRTRALLQDRVQNDPDIIMRKYAIKALARGWKDDPDTLPIIKSRATQDDDNDVRKAAVQELARGWKDDPDTLPWLKSRAAQDENLAVRHAAVQELARGWKDDPDTLPIIKSRATQDEDEAVRKASVQELAWGWKDDPDTLPIIKSRATQDDDNDVRHAAVRELVRGWKNDPDTYDILCECAVDDPFEQSDDEFFFLENHPRQAALKALVRYFPDRPHTLDLLQDRAQNDPDEKVRKYAAKVLERLNQDVQDGEGFSG